MHIFLLVIIAAALVSMATVRPGQRALRPIFVWALLATLALGVVVALYAHG